MPGAPPTAGGYGQLDPSDTSTEYGRLSFIIRQHLARMNTAKMAQVLSVQGGGLAPVGTVSVQIMTNQVDGNGQSTPHGEIFNVPYVRVQGGRNAIISDPKQGDIGLLVCCDRDTSAARASGKVANPGSSRLFSAADGMFIGVTQTEEAPEQYVQFTDDGMVLHDKNGNDFTLGPEGVVVTPATGLFKVMGSVEATGQVTALSETSNSVTMTGHIHTQPPDSHGDAESPTMPPNPGT